MEIGDQLGRAPGPLDVDDVGLDVVAQVLVVAGRWTEYFYDADPGNRDIDHQTNNNRLLWYHEYDPEYESGTLPLRTVKYTYYKNGRASNITIYDSEDMDGESRQIARDLALYYAANGSLWLAIRGTWSIDGEGDVVENSYATIDGREFRYDGLRSGRLSRAVDGRVFTAK